MSSLNIIKKYPELLELAYLSEREREHDLHAIFKRDIEDNCQFSFRGWRIYPIKTDGEIDMARLFKHLTCEEIMVENEDGTTYPKRVFEMARSQRLHWINHHVRELTPDNLDVFTIEERDGKKRKVKKTYIYDKVEKYVIVLEQQRSNGFYLLTAYHLNKEYGLKALEKEDEKRDCRHHYKTQDPNCIKRQPGLETPSIYR